MKKIKQILAEMFREELDIQHKLLNLILSAAFGGGCISLIISIILKLHISSILSIAFLILVVGVCLWIANGKEKPQFAALLVVLAANMVIFPVMYFTSGGMKSGMPVWLVLGMIFSWLILKGVLCVSMYILNAMVVTGCMLVEMYHPELVVPLESREAAYWDMIQSMIVVTCIFGLIFKYQTYVYEKQKKQIVKANQAKSEFLANMSHEIRTPINAILGYNEMIMKDSRESQTAEYALNVQSAGRTLLSLVNDILDFTNIEEKEIVLKNEPYRTLELLQDILAYAEFSAEKKGLEIRIEIDEQIPQVLLGDAIRITQIFHNLISNAVKYTPEGHIALIIKWEENVGALKVEVHDTGIGMKPEELEQISESFIRFDKHKTRNIQGIGLGLSVVTRLLMLMNSQLMVESEPGKGSVFSFVLPQEVVDVSPIGKYERKRDYSLQDNLADEVPIVPDVKVLIVDDNQMNLDLLARCLKATSMQIDSATNGLEAVELARKNTYHMVLMDHMMPIMDGVEALHTMKEEGLCENVPVIVLTANAVGNVWEEYLQEGFDDYLSKPISSRQLYALIGKYLSEYLRTQEDNTFWKQLPQLNKEIGMEYCCGSEEFYKEMLTSYLANNKLEEIKMAYEKADWEQYRILVHALKSTSLSIGAVAVSENAKKLEMAAKEQRIQDIIEEHEGVMSQYQKLLIQLQAALEEETAVVEEPVEQEFQKELILVVDDDIMNLQIAERMLGTEFAVCGQQSGKAALEYLTTQVPNLILLDLHMPEMDGFEVLKQIRRNDRLKDIPIVFLTADNDSDTEIKGFREGALDFIRKPFVADIMLQRIKRILELDRLQRSLQKEVKRQTKNAEARREKVERLSLQTMLTLSNTIDAKDRYTNGHSIRVAEYSKEIAKRAGKSEQEQEDIYYVGLLHDIGKIGIPNTIINKTTALSEEEYEVIKTHPKIGAEILQNMTEIPGLSVGAHYHHELYNGKGYPNGLAGEDIPEIARIIGVADAYDAMASKRSYRDVLPQAVIRDEIVKGKGEQFDPVFADILIGLIDEDVYYEMREQSAGE